MPKRIIVAGIYRSGTSLTTRLIQRWGAYVGKDEDLFQDEFGYLEHLGLQKLNDDLLENNSRIPTKVDVLLEKAKDPTLRQQAMDILATMDEQAKASGAQAWVWKDPRLPLVIPFWEQIWEDVIYIIPVRHPVETIRSSAKMDGLDPDTVPVSAGLAYWQFCMLNIIQFTQNAPQKFFLGYDQLLDDPYGQCLRLCKFLDAACGLPASGQEDRARSMSEVVSSSQHHYIASKPLLEFDVVERKQNALYNFLRLKTLYPHEPFLLDDFSMHPAWYEYLAMADTLMSMFRADSGKQE